ncbi:MAG: anticodon nuclease [Woeseia sp.]
MVEPVSFPDLPALAQYLRDELENKKFILLYAYNGVGKTRLSTEFKNFNKDAEDGIKRDTLYFNAFTEDLFIWNNDLENDQERYLKLTPSRFFDGFKEFEVETRIRTLLDRYVDFGFEMNLETDLRTGELASGEVIFSREVIVGEGERARLEKVEHIKISRSEESMFIWCFFIALLELALDRESGAYEWVKYIYVDDPISSLDDQNAVQVAVHLLDLLTEENDGPRVVISSHHPLFYNVLCNELRGKKASNLFLGVAAGGDSYTLQKTGQTPFFHHMANLVRLWEDANIGKIERRHYNSLRAIAEKAVSFHGYWKLEDCIVDDADKLDSKLHRRFLNLYSHGGYAHFEPDELDEKDQRHFKDILVIFLKRFRFNPQHFEGLLDSENGTKANDAQ